MGDGYGITIQESLDLGVVPIASNVCKRPKGTILFENGNKTDLLKKVNYVLKLTKYQAGKLINASERLSYHEILINKYEYYLSEVQ